MFELLLATSALVLTAGTAVAYRRTRDILHPLLFLGPLFLYGTVLEPWLVRNQLDRFFVNQKDVEVVLYLYLLSVAALAIGVLHRTHTKRDGGQGRVPIRQRDRLSLQRIAILLATVGLATYAYGILNVGGFVAAFSRVKGGGYTSSGYTNEAMNLGLVAAALVALARYRRGWTQGTLVLLFLGLLPNLVQGTFGGRRGPLFLSLTGLVVAWLITRPQRPRLLALCCALTGVFLSVALVWSQRSFLYLGSDEEVNWGAFQTTLSQQEINEGSNFVYGAGLVSATRHSGEFTWGRRLAVNLLVRPIPKQLWPTKYEDAGADWVTNEHPGLAHLTTDDWLNAVGWLPLAGSSASSISDLFSEFGWAAVLVMYLVGRGFAFLRSRRLSSGGVWDLLYFEALILSIYLATQSFSAFYHRFLILAVPTIVAWNVFLHRQPRSHRVPPRVGTVCVLPSPNDLASSQTGAALRG